MEQNLLSINNHISRDKNPTVKGDNDILINSLNSEIAFQRSELAIKLLK